MSILGGNYSAYPVTDSTFDFWNGKQDTPSFASPTISKLYDTINELYPSVNSAQAKSSGDPFNLLPSVSDMQGLFSGLTSSQAWEEYLSHDLGDHPTYQSAYDKIKDQVHNQDITDTATGEDNQNYFEGLASSLGELQKQQMSYNERRDKMYMMWQEAMSNTAYQRAMADMKAAGLNPILAYQQGGASTPSVTSSNYSLGGGDTLTDFVNMITSGASNLLRAIANFLPAGQADKLVEVAKEISYSNGKTSVHTTNTYG